MAKYVIDVPDEAVGFMDGEMSFFVEPKIKDERRRHYVLRIDEEDVSIYTEPDREDVEDEVWKMARLISLDGGLSSTDLYECYKSSDIQKVMRTHSYQEAKTKYDAWKKSKEEIRVGDELINHLGKPYIIYHIDRDSAYGVDVSRGYPLSQEVFPTKNYIPNKTGRYFPEIVELTKKMRGEEK